MIDSNFGITADALYQCVRSKRDWQARQIYTWYVGMTGMTVSQTEPVSFQDPAKLKSQYQEQKLLAEIERFVGHDLSNSKRDIILPSNKRIFTSLYAWSVMKGVMLVLQKYQNTWNWDDRVIVWHMAIVIHYHFDVGDVAIAQGPAVQEFTSSEMEKLKVHPLLWWRTEYGARERDRRKLGKKDDMESLGKVISSLTWLRVFQDFSCVHCAGLQCYSRWIL